MNRPHGLNLMALMIGLVPWVQTCRNGSGESAPELVTNTASIQGTIRSVTGSQNEMAGWVLVMFEKDLGISRVNDISTVGTFELKQVSLDKAHSIVLLDPQFRFSSILTYPGSKPGSVQQYFKMEATELPTLVHNGPILNFSETTNITWESNFASDDDSDLIPNGQETLLRSLNLADTDGDSIENQVDPDIDGDGIPNWFDSDDDGDGLIDVFDADSNGDDIPNITQSIGDIHYNRGLSYVVVQGIQDVQADGSLQTSLILSTKIHSDYAGEAIRIRAANSLVAGATAISIAPNSGDQVTAAWDGALLDDGFNEDGAAEDGIFGRKVVLSPSIVPKANQVIFFQVEKGTGDQKYFEEYPFTFPNVTTGVVTGTYDQATRTVTKSGQPFGTVEDYLWSVHIFDGNSIKVFSSEPISGKTQSYTIQADILDLNQSYTAKVVASSLARIPSYPTWIVSSQSFQIQ